MASVRPFLWFAQGAEEAAHFYCSIFPDARMIETNPMATTFEVQGQQITALNGNPGPGFNESMSLFVACAGQAEVDYYWERLTADGGEEGPCGWLRDKYGLSWQVIPDVLGRLLGDPDRDRANRAVQAMLGMHKLIVAELERA